MVSSRLALAGQHGDHFAIADRLRGHVRERPGAGHQSTHLVDEAGLEETQHAAIDAIAQDRARRLEGEYRDGIRRRLTVFDLKRRERPSGLLDHLESTNDSPAVAGMKPGCRHGIELRQAAVKGFLALEARHRARVARARPGRPPAPRKARGAAPSSRAEFHRRTGLASLAARFRRSRIAPIRDSRKRSPFPRDRSRRSRDERMPPRSAIVGLAVPISIPRYKVAESSATISASSRRASATPTAVFPDAVGPVK